MQPLPPFPSLDTLFQQADALLGPVLLLLFTLSAVIATAARDWRLVLAAFMAIYLALALYTARLLPPQWALLRVVVGGLAGVMWYLSAQQAGWGGRFLPFQRSLGVQARPLASTTIFRALLAISMAVVLWVLRARLPLSILPTDVRLAAYTLAAFGLLGLALGEEALQTGVALLFWLAATQLLVAVLQQDAWLIWLLSALELLLALTTGYLMIARGAETGER
ncbi:MAG: hypothetical protein ABTQ73_02540 [Caldilineales bacterium]